MANMGVGYRGISTDSRDMSLGVKELEAKKLRELQALKAKEKPVPMVSSDAVKNSESDKGTKVESDSTGRPMTIGLGGAPVATRPKVEVVNPLLDKEEPATNPAPKADVKQSSDSETNPVSAKPVPAKDEASAEGKPATDTELPSGYKAVDNGVAYTLQKSDAGSGITQLISGKKPGHEQITYVDENGQPITDRSTLVALAKGIVSSSKNNEYIATQSKDYKYQTPSEVQGHKKPTGHTGVDRLNGSDTITFSDVVEIDDGKGNKQKFYRSRDIFDKMTAPADSVVKPEVKPEPKHQVVPPQFQSIPTGVYNGDPSKVAGTPTGERMAASQKRSVRIQTAETDQKLGVVPPKLPKAHRSDMGVAAQKERREYAVAQRKYEETRKTGSAVTIEPEHSTMSDVISSSVQTSKGGKIDPSSEDGKKQMDAITQYLQTLEQNRHKNLPRNGETIDLTNNVFIPNEFKLNDIIYRLFLNNQQQGK